VSKLLETELELIFGIGNQNSYLVNRNSGGGFQFSRDPLNLVNKHSYKVRDISGIKRNGRTSSGMHG
jgi:hypothetical protein